MMKNKQEIINQYNPKTIFEYEGKLYFTTNDMSENLFNADGSILGKFYQPEAGKIMAHGKIVYQAK